jgi:thioredoxin 1
MKFKTIILTTFLFGIILAACSQSADVLSVDDFETKLRSTPDAQLVDARTPGEFAKAYIPGAANIDYNGDDFKEKVKSLDKSKPIFIYCLSGGRSAKAATYLRKQGFKTFELKGGMLEWNNKKKPVEGAGSLKGMSSPKFNKEVNQDKLVLVDFYATWCGPCKIMAPDLEALKQQYADQLVLVKVDADTNTYLIDSLRIIAIPTLQMYKRGEQVWTHTGLLSKKEIEKTILEKL